MHIVKDIHSTEVHFGDIVEIGDNRRVVYFGNGNWRENDNPHLNKHWSTKVYHYGAEDIESWPEFIKTELKFILFIGKSLGHSIHHKLMISLKIIIILILIIFI